MKNPMISLFAMSLSLAVGASSASAAPADTPAGAGSISAEVEPYVHQRLDRRAEGTSPSVRIEARRQLLVPGVAVLEASARGGDEFVRIWWVENESLEEEGRVGGVSSTEEPETKPVADLALRYERGGDAWEIAVSVSPPGMMSKQDRRDLALFRSRLAEGELVHSLESEVRSLDLSSLTELHHVRAVMSLQWVLDDDGKWLGSGEAIANSAGTSEDGGIELSDRRQIKGVSPWDIGSCATSVAIYNPDTCGQSYALAFSSCGGACEACCDTEGYIVERIGWICTVITSRLFGAPCGIKEVLVEPSVATCKQNCQQHWPNGE